jgi:Zn-dependent alcohol dehydrogenase
VTGDHLTTSIRPLEQVNEALDDLGGSRGLRSVLVP